MTASYRADYDQICRRGVERALARFREPDAELVGVTVGCMTFVFRASGQLVAFVLFVPGKPHGPHTSGAAASTKAVVYLDPMTPTTGAHEGGACSPPAPRSTPPADP